MGNFCTCCVLTDSAERLMRSKCRSGERTVTKKEQKDECVRNIWGGINLNNQKQSLKSVLQVNRIFIGTLVKRVGGQAATQTHAHQPKYQQKTSLKWPRLIQLFVWIHSKHWHIEMFVKWRQVLTSSKEILQQKDASVYMSKQPSPAPFPVTQRLICCLKSNKKTGLTLSEAALKCITLNHV